MPLLIFKLRHKHDPGNDPQKNNNKHFYTNNLYPIVPLITSTCIVVTKNVKHKLQNKRVHGAVAPVMETPGEDLKEWMVLMELLAEREVLIDLQFSMGQCVCLQHTC